MATIKHIPSKNADYGAAEAYLTFEHDEFTMKPTLDEAGRLIPRQDFRLDTLNCGGEDFALSCIRANLRYGKNNKRDDVKSHHYIISFDPRDAADNGLTVDRAQALGLAYCKEHFPGHQALICTHPDGHNHSGNIHVHIVINRCPTISGAGSGENLQTLHQLRTEKKRVLTMKTTNGIHTFSLKVRSSYSGIQNIITANTCIRMKRDKFGLNNNYCIPTYKSTGVEILLHQSIAHPCWITLIVNPSSLLAGTYQPVSLYQPDKKSLRKLHKRLRGILDKVGIEQRLREFKLSRCDLTQDIYCESVSERMLRLDCFRKSLPIRSYQPVTFGKYEKTEEKWRGANQHSWTITNKSCAFSVYDKTYELKARHDIKIEDSILRIELRLERKVIKKKIASSTWEEQLLGLFEKQKTIMDKFLHRLHQDYAVLVKKEEALARIEQSAYRKETKKMLRRIVKKADGCKSLAAVRKESRIKKSDFMKMLDRFSGMGFSPLILPDGFAEERLEWM